MTETKTQMTTEVPHEKIVSGAKNFLIKKGYSIISDNNTQFDIVAWEPEEEELHFVNAYQVDEWPECIKITRLEFEKGMSEFIIEHLEEMDAIGNNFAIRYDECCMKVANSDRAILRFHSNCFNDGSDIEGGN